MDVLKPQKSIVEDFKNNTFYLKAQRGTSHGLGPEHIHDHFQIWYVLEGNFRHIVNGNTYEHRKDELLIIPPYITHAIDTSDASPDLEFAFCDLADNFLDLFPEGQEKTNLFYLTYIRPLAYNAVSFSPFLAFSGEDARQMRAIYIRLVNEYSRGEHMSTSYIRTDLIRLFTIISLKYSSMVTEEKKDDLYRQYKNALAHALDYIDAHYTESISVSDVCSIALMSASSFSYVFKQLTGQTLIEYINAMRIRRAVELLESSSLAVKDIGWKCGFSDPTHFRRIFKRHMGMLPKQYQMQNRKGNS